MLAALILLDDDQAGGQVRQSHGRIGSVDVLTAGAAGAIDIDLDIVIVNLDIHLVRLWQHSDGGGAGVDAPARFRDGHPLHAVDAAFKLQLGKNARPGNICDHFLEATDFIGVGRDHLDTPAHLRGVAFVHAIEVGGEQGRFVATGSGADLQHGRARVRRIAGQHGDGQRPFGFRQFVAQACEFFLGKGPHFRVGFIQRGKAGLFGPQRRDMGSDAGNRFQFGIIAACSDKIRALQRAGAQASLQLGKARRDLGQAGVGNGHSAITASKMALT